MEVVQISVLGGLLALDGTSVGQFMFSRPLVAGVVAGWLLGDPLGGMAVGAILELYLLVSFPTGGSRFPEGGTATVVAVAASQVTDATGALPLAVAVGLVWGQLAGMSVSFYAACELTPRPGARGRAARRAPDRRLPHGRGVGRLPARLDHHLCRRGRRPCRRGADARAVGLVATGVPRPSPVGRRRLVGHSPAGPGRLPERERSSFAAGLALGVVGGRIL